MRTRGRTGSIDLAISAVVILTAVAFALRVYHIGDQSLWLDEGYTLLFSRLSLDRLFLVGGAHEHPPLYYLIVHFALGAYDSALVPRLISAVAGCLSVPVLYLLGARLFNRATGLIAAGLLAISPFHVWFAQDGRAYELAGLFVLLSYLLLFVALEIPRPAVWVGYALSLVLALYSEYTTALVLIPQLLLWGQARQALLHTSLLKAWGGAALAFAPWLVTLALDASSIAGNYWIPPPTLDDLFSTIRQFLGLRTPCTSPPCNGQEAALPLLMSHEKVVGAVVLLACVGVLIAGIVRRQRLTSVLALWLLLPFGIVLALAAERSLYLDRIFLDATFPLYLLIGAGVVSLARNAPRTALATGLICLLGIATMANLRLVYSEPSNPDWKSAAHDLRSAYRPGQAVVYNPGVLQPLVRAYLPEGWKPTAERPIWYHTYLDVPGWQDRYRRATNHFLRETGLSLQVRNAALDKYLRDSQLSSLKQTRQVWLVTQDYAGFSDTRGWFAANGYHLLLSQLYFNDSRIELWDKGLPKDFGPEVAATSPSQSTEGVSARGDLVTEHGHTALTRRFRLQPGATYVMNVEYRAATPARPTISLRTVDSRLQTVGGMTDRFGNHLATFPRTEWYDMPVNGVWISQPFGFVAPSGSAWGILKLQNLYGAVQWRNIKLFREAP